MPACCKSPEQDQARTFLYGRVASVTPSSRAAAASWQCHGLQGMAGVEARRSQADIGDIRWRRVGYSYYNRMINKEYFVIW